MWMLKVRGNDYINFPIIMLNGRNEMMEWRILKMSSQSRNRRANSI